MTVPPQELSGTLNEKNILLKNLEQRASDLENLVALGRKDADFDLFCRRVQMVQTLSVLSPEAMQYIHLQDWYFDFWKLASELRVTKFQAEEKNISQQISAQIRRENNPIVRQYLTLALISFGELQESEQHLEPRFWSSQLIEDFDTFLKWYGLINNPLTPQAQAKILRNNRILAFLQEKYSDLIKKYSQAVIDEKNCPRVSSEDYQIYFCWFQGEGNLPPIVQCCYNSLKQNAGRYKIVFIDEKNLLNYVDIAPHIMDKLREGKISRTHFSDILRVYLLEQYGGLWLDSTTLVTEPLENHKELLEEPFFTMRFHKEKNYKNSWAIHVTFGRWASFIQGTNILHNPLFAFEKEFLNEYWKEFNRLTNYYLIDFMMALAYDNIPVVTKIFDEVPINNTDIYFIQSHLNDQYLASSFDKILSNTFLHKLSWKKSLDMTTPETIFREIQRRYAPESVEE